MALFTRGRTTPRKDRLPESLQMECSQLPWRNRLLGMGEVEIPKIGAGSDLYDSVSKACPPELPGTTLLMRVGRDSGRRATR